MHGVTIKTNGSSSYLAIECTFVSIRQDVQFITHSQVETARTVIAGFLSFQRFRLSALGACFLPFSKLICCSCWIEFSSTTFSSSWMFLSRISVDGKAMVGGGLGKSRWWKFNLLFKLGGDVGDCECNELSETSMSDASSTSKLLSTWPASGEPAFWSYSGVVDRSRLFFDKFKMGLSFVGDTFWELLCLSFSSWFSSSFSFLNLDKRDYKAVEEEEEEDETELFNGTEIMQGAYFLPFEILHKAFIRCAACLP